MTQQIASLDKSLEDRLRREARKQGYILHKERIPCRMGYEGGWQIVEAQSNRIITGENFNLSTRMVEWFLMSGKEEQS